MHIPSRLHSFLILLDPRGKSGNGTAGRMHQGPCSSVIAQSLTHDQAAVPSDDLMLILPAYSDRGPFRSLLLTTCEIIRASYATAAVGMPLTERMHLHPSGGHSNG